MNDSLEICIFGNQKTTTELIKNLLKNKHGISYVVTLKKNESTVSKISNIDLELDEFCKLNGINIYYADSYSLDSSRDIEFFLRNKFDIGMSCSWQRIIPKIVLDSFKFGVFGWHGSMFKFPNGRGRSPLNWSIRLGGTRIYHNLFKYDSGIDTGDIFETKEIKIDDSDNIRTLLPKIQDHMNSSSVRLLDSIYMHEFKLEPQVGNGHILFPKLTEESGKLLLNSMFYSEANNIVRSCTHPFPGAFILHNGNKIKIWEMKKSIIKKLNPGEVCIKKNTIYLGFVDGTGKAKI